MKFRTITPAQLQGKGVVGLPDTPGLATSEMQRKMDELAAEVIVPAFNELAHQLDGLNLDQRVKSGDVKAVRVNADNQLEISRDGTNFEATGAAGHMIVTATGTAMPQRGRLKFGSLTKLTDDVEANATLIEGIKGDRGPIGPVGPVGPQGVEGQVMVPYVDVTGTISWTLRDLDDTQLPMARSIMGPQGAQGIQGVQGVQGLVGAQGPLGPQGVQGPLGDVGPIGKQGPVGAKGDQGATFLHVSAPPSSGLGRVGDWALNPESGDLYEKVSGTGWQARGCIVGPQGETGPRGYIGDTGAPGPVGPQGESGTTGPEGPQGVQGLIGPTGSQGPAGPMGAKGEQGDMGVTGPAGPAGIQGSVGPGGPQGEKGDTGATGPKGPAGIQGPVGPTGAKGEKGDTGLTGPAGPAGIQGPVGSTGAKGEKGDTGATGPAGSTGPKGSQGIQGPMGPQGPEGDAGTDGRSFTILALYPTLLGLQTDHPTGTAGQAYAVGSMANNDVYIWDVERAAWVNIGTMQGPMGPQGIQGVQGVQGLVGPQGDKGATGPAGPQGIKGDTGEQGLVGPKGNVGATGLTGPQGAKGDTGAQGLVGPKGDIGATGPAGPQGARGVQGIQGLTGAKGDTGPTGATGPQGAKGATGSQGPIGPAGPTGPQGQKGDTGSQGAKGATGATGTRGSLWYQGTAITGTSATATVFSASGVAAALVNDKYLNTATGCVYNCTTAGVAAAAKWVYIGSVRGVTGAAGPQGIQGVKGDTGAQGAKGDTGPTGPAGPQGVKGATGTQGPTGSQGPQGIQGVKGAQGIQGIQGPQGDRGAQGLPTIVNGKSADSSGAIALTAADVAALPTGGTAANASKLGNQLPAYYAPLRKLDYVYKATLLLDGWAGSAAAGYTQTATIASIDGGPAVTASTALLGPMLLPTGVQATDAILAEGLRIVNDGVTTPAAGKVTCKVWEKPTADAAIYWPGKVGS